MASWIEIERIRKDAEEARRIAKGLRHYEVEPGALTDWEVDFLESTQSSRGDELTTRWSEKLLQVRDDVERVTTHKGISVSRLVHGCYEARLDLDEEDEEWIIEIFASSPVSVRKKHLWRLLRCARQLGLIENYMVG